MDQIAFSAPLSSQDERPLTARRIKRAHDRYQARCRRSSLVTAEWLKNDLPPVALLAIQAHDHRTGIVSETNLADALKLADAIAIGEITAGRQAMVSALAKPDNGAAMRSALTERPYLPRIILNLSQNHGISLAAMADVCSAAPPQ
ncbi:hypothetical protein [Chelativorans salis]|uniref:Uncharacterized protein n=1 Tax=Chelativorans salis TaxID=2978478 RepID=A0ABT2LHL9_9HYPH|nr:hypothetical protein [Chelativorans sp. EGI FJ00035]MCT7374062.1 hypothetical protein [Chelativorans sp. EGI FJ00035]